MINFFYKVSYILIFICVLTASGFFLGCSTKRPVLYPNDRLMEVGKTTAQRDIDDCIDRADLAGLESGQSGKVAEKTAKGGIKGAAVGTAAGAVTGRVGRGAGIGAAAGGMSGFIDGLFSARDPDPVEKRFIEECLRERGYRPIGWQ
jgi:outer membrane lipoprotein SlyB